MLASGHAQQPPARSACRCRRWARGPGCSTPPSSTRSASASSPEASRIRGPSPSFPTAACWSPSGPAGSASFATACSTRNPIAGVPPVRTDGNGGLMDVALHPRFADNRLVYLTYTKPVGNGRGAPALARGQARRRRADRRPRSAGHRGLRRQLGSERPRRLRARRHGLHVHRRQYRQGRARSRQPARQDPAPQRRWLRAPRQPVREPRGLPAGNLHAGASQHARPHRPSRDRRAVEPRKRSQRRRRNQHHPARPQLRMADRELRPRLSRPAHLRTSDAGGDGVAARGLAAGRSRSPAWRSTPATASPRGRATSSSARCARAESRHRPPAAHRVQREDRGDAARVDADRVQAAHPRSASGSRWAALSADRRRRRRASSNRAGAM